MYHASIFVHKLCAVADPSPLFCVLFNKLFTPVILFVMLILLKNKYAAKQRQIAP